MIRPVLLATSVALGGILVNERRQRHRAERFSAAALESLLRAIDANDPQTGAHVRRVAAYSLPIAYALGVDERVRRTIELTALFHDVGKIHEALFDVVHEPRKLTPAERRAIRTHPIRGAEVLGPIGHFHPQLAEAVLSHHERWDGRGYPRGLRGDRIPLAARVVALADTFDVVTHGRRYRDSRTPDEAQRIILEGRGTQFDPELVDLVLLPPVFNQIMRAERRFERRLHTIPKRRLSSHDHDSAPKVGIRWRTRSDAPHVRSMVSSRAD
ncbi:MAG: HD-GYP domain-containing protein [Gemmatimonadaceae bacterium]